MYSKKRDVDEDLNEEWGLAQLVVRVHCGSKKQGSNAKFEMSTQEEKQCNFKVKECWRGKHIRLWSHWSECEQC